MAATPVPIEIESRRVDTGEMMVTVTGELDLATTPHLQKTLSRYKGRVVLDLRRVEFIDSTGIRMMIQEKKRLVAAGSDLRLLINPTVRRLVELTGIDDMFQIDESLHPTGDEPPSDETPQSIALQREHRNLVGGPAEPSLAPSRPGRTHSKLK
jgi:anti-sigma B factor antagonist